MALPTNKYPDYIMGYVRQNLGLEEDDTSKDAEINNMSKHEVFNRVCEWEGLINYGSEIRSWIQSIYSINLEG